MASLHEPGFVAAAYGLKKGSSRDGSAVDEHVDIIALSSCDVGCADPTAPAFLTRCVLVFNRLVQRDEFRSLRPHDVVQSIQHVVGSRDIEQGPSFCFEMKSTSRVGQGMVNHHVNNTRRFSLWTSLEGQTSRGVLEQMINRYHGTFSHSDRFNCRFQSVFHDNGCPLFTVRFAGDLQF